MTVTTTLPEIFQPQPTPDSQPFWDGLAAHELRMPFCTACERYFFPPMPGCPFCSVDADRIEQRVVSGEGTIYSWIVAHLAFDPAFADDVPYTIVTVDLVEGPRINGRLRGIEIDSIQAGTRVKAEYEDRPGFTMLHFSPVTD
jgi:uncharacterized OB-fold protein